MPSNKLFCWLWGVLNRISKILFNIKFFRGVFFSLYHEIRQKEGEKPSALFGLPVEVFQSEPSEICVTHNPHGFCFLKINIFVVRLVGTISLSPSPTFLRFSEMLPNMGYSGEKNNKPAGLPSFCINVTLTKPEHVFL